MVAVRPIPPLDPTAGWREVPIDPVDEPLVPVADLAPSVLEDPRYIRMGLPGAVPGCHVRRGVAERLLRAAAALPAGHRLLVWDGWRSFETQSALFRGYLDELTARHPGWSRAELEDAASRYVSPPSLSPDAPSPHLTGGAVDLTLASPEGAALDLGTDFDAFVPEAGALALEHGGPSAARDRRRALFWAMHDAGFTLYVEEWWHFDLGDQFWGLVTGRRARYGPAAPPQDP